MRFRRLRIAFSAVCGLMCVLLIALWVRSYWRGDVAQVRPTVTESFGIGSVRGSIGFDGKANPFRSWRRSDWKVWSYPAEIMDPDTFRFEYDPIVGIDVTVPHWTLVLLFGILAAGPWLRWPRRFSLGTLLIGTTLVAAVLGLIMWARSQEW
jgi:hypothetical protein